MKIIYDYSIYIFLKENKIKISEKLKEKTEKIKKDPKIYSMINEDKNIRHFIIGNIDFGYAIYDEMIIISDCFFKNLKMRTNKELVLFWFVHRNVEKKCYNYSVGDIMRKKKQEVNKGVILFFVFVIILGVYSAFDNELIVINYDINENVKAYEPLIKKYAKKYEIEDYVPLIMSVMMQESKGKGLDPMQSSECIYNKEYSVKPNGIQDTEYSINVGIHYLALCLKEANVESITDENGISLALQGYNYGHGYIKWALKNYGGYSKDNAVEFSNKMKKELDRNTYGDTDYVAHVLKYYAIEEKNERSN